MLHIYSGRENVDKDNFIFENIRLRGREKNILLVPDQFTLEAERKAFKCLKTRGLMGLEVLSPSRLGQRILAETGTKAEVSLNNYGRHMLISGILTRHKDSLGLFAGMGAKSAFVDMLADIISEFKQYGTDPAEIFGIMQPEEQKSVLGQKLKDISLIYEQYEREIADKYIDAEDYIEIFINKIRDSRLVKESEIWVYGFDYFTPKNFKFLGELMKYAASTHIVLSYDDSGRDRELFQITGELIERLKDMAKLSGMEYRLSSIDDKTGKIKEKPEELAFLEKNLYALPGEKYGKEPENIRLVKASNPYTEVETAVAYIHNLIRKEGLRYRDIAVICNDLDSRGSILLRTFEEFGIPCFMDRRKSIIHSPVVNLNLLLLEMAGGKVDTEIIIGFMKTGFVGLDYSSVEKLENYAKKYRLKGWTWNKAFTKTEKKDEKAEQELEELNAYRQITMNKINSYLKAVKKAETMGEALKALYDFIDVELNLSERLQEMIGRLEQERRYEEAIELSQLWDMTVDLYEQFFIITANEEADPKYMASLLRAGFEAMDVGMLPATLDEVLVGTMQRTRVGQIKALVVLGVNDGILPQTSGDNSILSEEDRLWILERKEGAVKRSEPCKSEGLRVKEEKLAIYRMLCSPENFLYISAAVSDSEGGELKPSMLYTRLVELFPEMRVRKDLLSAEEAYGLLENKSSGLRHLASALREARQAEKEPDREWVEALRWYKEHDKQGFRKIYKGLTFSPKGTSVNQKLADALYGIVREFPDSAILTVSPSRMENYGRCPFSHFIKYGLKPEEMRTYDISGMDMGDLYHISLMKLAEHLSADGLPVNHEGSMWSTIDEDSCKALINRFIDEEIVNYRGGVFVQGSYESYRVRRIKRVCEEVAVSLVEQVKKGSIEKMFFEESFTNRKKSKFPAVGVETSQGVVEIEGKIDRVDILKGGYVKVIDYKSGAESFRASDVLGGLKLQLMLYLEAALGRYKQPGGMFYFKIVEKDIDGDLMGKSIDSESIRAAFQKSFKLDGMMIDDQGVLEAIAGDFDGYSDIAPLRKTKDGEVKATSASGLLSPDEFKEFREQAGKKSKEICEEISKGDMDILPAKSDNISACEYCKFASICNFDICFDGCRYRKV